MQDKLYQKEIGHRIKELRKSFGYTQDELAELVDLTTNHIRSIEAGRRGITAEMLTKLKKIFNVSADYLLTGSAESNDISRLQAILSGVDSVLYPYIEQAVIFLIKFNNQKTFEDSDDCDDANDNL